MEHGGKGGQALGFGLDVHQSSDLKTELNASYCPPSSATLSADAVFPEVEDASIAASIAALPGIRIETVADARTCAVIDRAFTNEQRARWTFRYESENSRTDQKACFGAVSSGLNKNYDNEETAWAYRAWSGALFGPNKDKGKPAASGRPKIYPAATATAAAARDEQMTIAVKAEGGAAATPSDPASSSSASSATSPKVAPPCIRGVSIVQIDWDGPRGELYFSVDGEAVNGGKPCFTNMFGLLSLFPAFFAYGPGAVVTLIQCAEIPATSITTTPIFKVALVPSLAESGAIAEEEDPAVLNATFPPRFDVSQSSSLVDLEYSNDFRTVKPRSHERTLAVAARGFKRGALAIWEFSLDADTYNDEAACFGFTTKPIVSRNFADGRQPMVIRGFSGHLYGQGAVGGLRSKIHPGAKVRFRANLTDSPVPLSAGASAAPAGALGSLPPNSVELIVNGTSQGVCWKDVDIASGGLWPCLAFYGPTSVVTFDRCEQVKAFSDLPAWKPSTGASAAGPSPSSTGSSTGVSPPYEPTTAVWDVEASAVVKQQGQPQPSAPFELDSTKRTITSLHSGRCVAVADQGFTKRCLVEYKLTRDVAGNECTLLGLTSEHPVRSADYDSNSHFLLRCYSGALYGPGEKSKNGFGSVRPGSTCTFIYDPAAATISAKIDDKDCGVLWRNIPSTITSKPLFPCVAFYSSQREVTLIRAHTQSTSQASQEAAILRKALPAFASLAAEEPDPSFSTTSKSTPSEGPPSVDSIKFAAAAIHAAAVTVTRPRFFDSSRSENASSSIEASGCSATTSGHIPMALACKAKFSEKQRAVFAFRVDKMDNPTSGELSFGVAVLDPITNKLRNSLVTSNFNLLFRSRRKVCSGIGARLDPFDSRPDSSDPNAGLLKEGDVVTMFYDGPGSTMSAYIGTEYLGMTHRYFTTQIVSSSSGEGKATDMDGKPCDFLVSPVAFIAGAGSDRRVSCLFCHEIKLTGKLKRGHLPPSMERWLYPTGSIRGALPKLKDRMCSPTSHIERTRGVDSLTVVSRLSSNARAVWDFPIRNTDVAVIEFLVAKETVSNETTCLGFSKETNISDHSYSSTGNFSYRCFNGAVDCSLTYKAAWISSVRAPLPSGPGSIIRFHFDGNGNCRLFVNNRDQGTIFDGLRQLNEPLYPAAFFYGSQKSVTLLRADRVQDYEPYFPPPISKATGSSALVSPERAPFDPDCSSTGYDFDDHTVTSTNSSNNMAIVNRGFTTSEYAVIEYQIVSDPPANQALCTGVSFRSRPTIYSYSSADGAFIRHYNGAIHSSQTRIRASSTAISARPSTGDRVRIHWHGPSGQLEWFHNDRALGVLFNNIESGTTIYPAVCSYMSQRSVTILTAKKVDSLPAPTPRPVSESPAPTPTSSSTTTSTGPNTFVLPASRTPLDAAFSSLNSSMSSNMRLSDSDRLATSLVATNSLAVVNAGLTRSERGVFAFRIETDIRGNEGSVYGFVFRPRPESFDYSNTTLPVGCFYRACELFCSVASSCFLLLVPDLCFSFPPFALLSYSLLFADNGSLYCPSSARRPAAPSNLTAAHQGDYVIFHWDGPEGTVRLFINGNDQGIIFSISETNHRTWSYGVFPPIRIFPACGSYLSGRSMRLVQFEPLADGEPFPVYSTAGSAVAFSLPPSTPKEPFLPSISSQVGHVAFEESNYLYRSLSSFNSLGIVNKRFSGTDRMIWSFKLVQESTGNEGTVMGCAVSFNGPVPTVKDYSATSGQRPGCFFRIFNNSLYGPRNASGANLPGVVEAPASDRTPLGTIRIGDIFTFIYDGTSAGGKLTLYHNFRPVGVLFRGLSQYGMWPACGSYLSARAIRIVQVERLPADRRFPSFATLELGPREEAPDASSSSPTPSAGAGISTFATPRLYVSSWTSYTQVGPTSSSVPAEASRAHLDPSAEPFQVPPCPRPLEFSFEESDTRPRPSALSFVGHTATSMVEGKTLVTLSASAPPATKLIVSYRVGARGTGPRASRLTPSVFFGFITTARPTSADFVQAQGVFYRASDGQIVADGARRDLVVDILRRRPAASFGDVVSFHVDARPIEATGYGNVLLFINGICHGTILRGWRAPGRHEECLKPCAGTFLDENSFTLIECRQATAFPLYDGNDSNTALAARYAAQ